MEQTKSKFKIEDYVPKKVVAVEQFRLHKRIQNLALLTIFGSIIGASIVSYSSMGGAASIGVVAAAAAFFLYKSRKEMLYLNKKYNLGFKIMQGKDITAAMEKWVKKEI